MKILSTAIVSSIYICSPAFSSEANVVSCRVAFDFGKTTFDKKSLNTCLADILKKDEVKNIDIIGSSSKSGSPQYNKKLSEKRADILEKHVKNEFPNTSISTSALGVNENYGRSGLIRFTSVAKKEVEEPKVIEAVVEEKIVEKAEEPPKQEEVVLIKPTEDNDKFFTNFSVRAGRDIYKYKIESPYLATGAEVGLQYQQNSLLRYELAIQGNKLTNVTGDKVLDLYTYYAAPGAYLTHSGFLIGVRGLAGGVTNDRSQSGTDFGGEVRAGYEYKALSIIFDGGRTESSVRFGMSLGFKI